MVSSLIFVRSHFEMGDILLLCFPRVYPPHPLQGLVFFVLLGICF